ncbi:MAG: L,D-transpeptidase [Verrucomicrobiota bacterium]
MMENDSASDQQREAVPESRDSLDPLSASEPTTRLEVSVRDQRLRLFKDGEPVREFPISTARNGIGTEEGSNKTPLGRFRICERIGDEAEPGTVFKSRQPERVWASDEVTDEDLVLTRILWLDGLDEDNANTRDRYIYIHGTNQEEQIGQPVSHGCIRMRNQDVIDLYAEVDDDTMVEIMA